MWPVYTDARWLAAGLFALLLLSLLATLVKTPFWQHLRSAWGREGLQLEHHGHPQMVLLPQLHA